MSGVSAEPPSILIVDDEPSIRSMLGAVFESDGYQVTTAVDAADGSAKLAASDFDVVITDMRMESATSGYDVVRAARGKNHPPPVIIMTAYPVADERWRAEGAHVVLGKPVPVLELLGIVQQLITTQEN